MSHEQEPPPDGFASWLEWLIEAYGTPSWLQAPAPPEAVRAAAKLELGALIGSSNDLAVRKAGRLPYAAPQIPTGLPGDPMELLGSAQFAIACGVVDEAGVRELERTRKVFSVRDTARVGRAYPAFQVWPEVFGTPLARALEVFRIAKDFEIHRFFMAQDSCLEWLTPVEALMGRAIHPARKRLGEDAPRLLGLPHEQRLDAVCAAAEAYLAMLRS